MGFVTENCQLLTFQIDAVSARGDEQLECSGIGGVGEVSLEVVTER